MWILDPRYWIPNSWSVELGFWIPIVSGIPDSDRYWNSGFRSLVGFRIPGVNGIPDSDRQWDSRFHSVVGFPIPIISGIPDFNR